MKGFKKCLGVVTAAAVLVTSVPVGAQTVDFSQDKISTDLQVVVHPEDASTFNDTDGDGFGEFQGWGTSLCWWANRLGYSEKLTEEAARVFFSDEGLDLNIGRYNIGGGDNVSDDATHEDGIVYNDDIPRVSLNEKATVYDLETDGLKPTYAGSKMQISTIDTFASAQFTATEPDFGFNVGDNAGSFRAIGYVNALGENVGSGDNLHYKVNAAEAGKYTFKVLCTLTGTNSRDVAIRVAEGTDDQKDYVCDSSAVNASVVASTDSAKLYVATIEDVELQAGENTINLAGKSGWTLDVIKMLVVKSEDSNPTPEREFTYVTHKTHITRSDSAIPGYAVDVCKIGSSEYVSYVSSGKTFAREDAECGYAWNYDWTADENQLAILEAAKAASGEDFIAEAFSNSPPYFMTYSGCSSGSVDASSDNLRADSYDAFGKYMADVIAHWAEVGLVDFQSATPMNEPYTNYWIAKSYKQEGCHFDQGKSESKVVVSFFNAMREIADTTDNENVKKVIDNMVYSASDETSIDTAITSYQKLSDEAKGIVGRIDTHTYSGSDRKGLCELAKTENKNLWMSEVDGAYTAGTKAGNMTAGLGISQAIMKDLKGLRATAWIMWNAVDTNVDANNDADQDDLKDLYTARNDQGQILYTPNGGYWGIALGDHNNEEIILTKKYYAMGQFSRYIRPGATIIDSTGDSLAAFDPKKKELVIVVNNTASSDKTCAFDLGNFSKVGKVEKAIRTSGVIVDTKADFDKEKLIEGENWADVTTTDNIKLDVNKQIFTADLKANSVTTYVVSGVEYDASSADYVAEVEEVALNADSVIESSEPWNGGTVDVATNVVDNDFNTFFDGVSDGYLILDLGKQYKIGAVGYAPRSGYADRCVGASFYGSNDKEDWNLLYTIVDTPKTGEITKATANMFGTTDTLYRYVKYAVPEGDGGAACNVSEIKIYSTIVNQDYLVGNVTKYEAKTTGKVFEEDTYRVYAEALNAAKALIGNEDATVAEIDAVVTNLQKAYDALQSFADTDELTSLVSEFDEAVEAKYSAETWAAYKAAADAAKEILAKENPSQSSVDEAVKTLKDAAKALESGVDKTALLSAIKAAEAINSANYTKASFDALQAALAEAKEVSEVKFPMPEDVENALVALAAKTKALVEKVAVAGTTQYEKKATDAPFALDARVTKGKATLSYTSSDANVAVVSGGKVTIKGAGVCTITVKATGDGTEASMKVTVVVSPKAVSLKSAKTVKGKKLKVTWAKDTTVSGYEVQTSLKKDFKSAKKTTIKKATATNTTLKKLKKGKKYYVRVRSYKDVTVNGKTVRLYSDWSKTKKTSKIK